MVIGCVCVCRSLGELMWIGLKQDGACLCLVLNDPCMICRDSWLWVDGTLMSWTDGWMSDVRPRDRTRGMLGSSGWDNDHASGQLKFICEKFAGML